MLKRLSLFLATIAFVFHATVARADSQPAAWGGFVKWILTEVWPAPHHAGASWQEEVPVIYIYIDIDKESFLSPSVPKEWHNVADTFLACITPNLFPDWHIVPPYHYEIMSSPSRTGRETIVPEHISEGSIKKDTCAQLDWEHIGQKPPI